MGFQPLFQVFMCFVTVCFLLCCSDAGDSVPFITWANHQYLRDIPSKSAGQIVDSGSLLSTYIQTIIENEQNKVIIVFNFNQLSIDDISKYGGAYEQNSKGGNLENFMHSYQNSASQLTMEMVEPVPLKLIEEKAVGPVIEYSEQWSSKLVKDQVNLLVVPLDLTTDRVSSFRKADDVIKKLMDRVLAMGMKFTAILTASHPSKILASRNEEPVIHMGRHLLQNGDGDVEESVPPIQFKTGGCHGLLYVSNIYVNASGDMFNASNDNWDTSESNCTKYRAQFVMSNSGESVKDFKMIFTFNSSSGGYYWTFLKTQVSFRIDNTTVYTIDDQIEASHTPRNFSFHCGHQELINVTDKKPVAIVQLLDFQVQPYNVNDTTPQFATANDCVGFVTPGIWMGLVTTLILVSILYFGVSMLASLTVMDQFDDPKGKTITVNVSE